MKRRQMNETDKHSQSFLERKELTIEDLKEVNLHIK